MKNIKLIALIVAIMFLVITLYLLALLSLTSLYAIETAPLSIYYFMVYMAIKIFVKREKKLTKWGFIILLLLPLSIVLLDYEMFADFVWGIFDFVGFSLGPWH